MDRLKGIGLCFGVFVFTACTVLEPEIIVRFRPVLSVVSSPSPVLPKPLPSAQTEVVTRVVVTEPSPMAHPSASLPKEEPFLPRVSPSPPEPSYPPMPERTPRPIQVLDVQLLPPLKTTLQVGDQLQLWAGVVYTHVTTYDQVYWQSHNPDVLSVDEQGQLVALQPGEAKVTVFAQADLAKKAEITFTIQPLVRYFTGTLTYLKNNQVYLMHGSSAQEVQLTNQDSEPKYYPRLSWDSRQVVYSTEHERRIYTLDTLGPGEPVHHNTIFTPSALPLAYFWYNQDIVFRNWRGVGSIQYGENEIEWTTGQGLIDYLGGITPHREIIYTQNGQMKYNRYLFLGNDIYRDYGPGEWPRIALRSSPTFIAYSYQGDIYRIPFEGGTPINLTQTPDIHETHPAISPDERQIVFVSDRDGSQDLFIMASDGTQVMNLSRTPGVDEYHPDWGP